MMPLSRFEFLSRGILYSIIAAVSAIQAGINASAADLGLSHHTLAILNISLSTISGVAITLRTFIDRSSSDRAATKATEDAMPVTEDGEAKN